MARSDNNLNAVFTDIANSIREKLDSQELISPRDYADLIDSIETGISLNQGVYQVDEYGEATQLANHKYYLTSDDEAHLVYNTVLFATGEGYLTDTYAKKGFAVYTIDCHDALINFNTPRYNQLMYPTRDSTLYDGQDPEFEIGSGVYSSKQHM